MIGGVNNISFKLAAIYQANNSLLSEALVRIASGKKVSSPSDDFAGYIRAQNYQQDIKGYELVKENLLATQVFTDAAVSVGQSIYDDLVEMQELEDMYDAEQAGANDPDVLAGYEADFKALRDSVADAINLTFVDGKQIVDKDLDITTVNMDPDGRPLTVTFSVEPNSGAIAAFDVTDNPDIGTEITAARTYLSEAEHFSNTINRQLTVIDTIIQSKQAAKSVITDIDDAEEQANLITYQLRTQASLAMIAQGNLNQSYIASLFGFTQ
jgi:flagellin-like hook-associated protein FlgL